MEEEEHEQKQEVREGEVLPCHEVASKAACLEEEEAFQEEA